MIDQPALMIASEIIRKANEVIQGQTHIIADALVCASPMASAQVPALAVLAPLVRDVLMPIAEHALTAEQITEITIALNTIEGAIDVISTTAREAKARIDALSESEIDQYVSLG